MLIRCEVSGSFYIELEDTDTPDIIEDKLANYINALEDLTSDHMSINEYTWDKVE